MSTIKTTELSKQLTQLRNGLSERSSPTDFVLAAIDQWATKDIFFREYLGPEALQTLRSGEDGRIIVFKTPGTDHYFGLFESRTLLLSRLGFNISSASNVYSHLFAAVTMQKLDDEGFEYFGTLDKPPIDVGDIQTKYFDIDSGRLGKVLKTTKYMAFPMTSEYGGEWLLIPKDNLLPKVANNV